MDQLYHGIQQLNRSNKNAYKRIVGQVGRLGEQHRIHAGNKLRSESHMFAVKKS
ncbi:MAG: hypothetical protein MUC60_07095 [Oscillatoria sp. Prado101]|nr:hypothetical protein [Oscillatoria sp. Prado101]